MWILSIFDWTAKTYNIVLFFYQFFSVLHKVPDDPINNLFKVFILI